MPWHMRCALNIGGDLVVLRFESCADLVVLRFESRADLCTIF